MEKALFEGTEKDLVGDLIKDDEKKIGESDKPSGTTTGKKGTPIEGIR